MTKTYIQPAVQVAQIALDSMILAGSPADTMQFNNIEGDQW